jgi:hypothetical protein
MTDTERAERAFLALVNMIVETVEETGDDGTPEGILYAALMGYGVSLAVFNRIISAAVEVGKIRKQGNLLYPA